MFFNGNTESKTEHTIWKSIKNWAENWWQIVCGILFDLICCMTSSAWKDYFFPNNSNILLKKLYNLPEGAQIKTLIIFQWLAIGVFSCLG